MTVAAPGGHEMALVAAQPVYYFHTKGYVI